jgi:mRNA export factor
MSFFAASTPAATAVKDIEVANPPADSISSLAFHPQADFLAVGSWSNEVSKERDLASFKSSEE